MSTVGRSNLINHQNNANGLTDNMMTDHTEMEMPQFELHGELLKRQVDRLAALLKGPEIHCATLEFLSNTSDGGAPSNTPVQSPKRYNYSSSKFTEGKYEKRIKPLKLLERLKESEDEHEYCHQPPLFLHQQDNRFLTVRDLLTSENNHDSTIQQHSSPLGDKTLDFINQTSMTPNNTLYHAHFHQEQIQSIKRYDAGESSTVVPMDVLEDNSTHCTINHNEHAMEESNMKTVDISITSSPDRNKFDGHVDPYNDPYNQSFISKNAEREHMFSNIANEKIYYANVLDLEVSKNLLALSSSPMPKFETKFPEPKPIYEFFDDDIGDDDIEDHVENTESIDASENEQTGKETNSDSEYDAQDELVETRHFRQLVEEPVKTFEVEPKPKSFKPDPKQQSKPKPKCKQKKKVTIGPNIQMNPNSVFKSDDIDEELKNPENNASYYSSPHNRSYPVSNIRTSLRKRKPISYNIETIASSGINDDLPHDSPKSSRQKRRYLRMKNSRTILSSSPVKRVPSSLSNKSSSYHQRRKRTVAPRSKSGCWTCRIRKKKCTEEKPSCVQCEKLGLRCDGYSDIKPSFMQNAQSQRKRLDEIRNHTSQRKKIGVKNIRPVEVENNEIQREEINDVNEFNDNYDH